METNRDKPELEEIDKVYDIDFDVTELLIVASILFFIWYLSSELAYRNRRDCILLLSH